MYVWVGLDVSVFLGVLLVHRGILFGISHGSSGVESQVTYIHTLCIK